MGFGTRRLAELQYLRGRKGPFVDVELVYLPVFESRAPHIGADLQAGLGPESRAAAEEDILVEPVFLGDQVGFAAIQVYKRSPLAWLDPS